MSKQAGPRTQELRRAQEVAAVHRSRRRRVLTVIGALVIVGLLGAITVAVVQAARHQRTLPSVSGQVLVPQHLTRAGTIPVGGSKAPVTVEIYFDYMCPACGAFEAANAGELDRLLGDGVVRVELRPIAFLDQQSGGTEYSSRAANAIATVADAAPERVWDFHTALYDAQPAEGSQGLTDEQIASIAAGAGVPADVVAAFPDGTYRPWVASTTRRAFASGLEHTPTVTIDGDVFTGNVFTPGPLTQAIESAAAAR